MRWRYIVYKDSFFTLQKAFCTLLLGTILLDYISKIPICYETHTNHTNKLCGLRARVLSAAVFRTRSNHWIFRGLSLKKLWCPNLYSHFGTDFRLKFWHDDSEVKTRISSPYKIRVNGFTVHCRSIGQWTIISFIAKSLSRIHCLYSP